MPETTREILDRLIQERMDVSPSRSALERVSNEEEYARRARQIRLGSQKEQGFFGSLFGLSDNPLEAAGGVAFGALDAAILAPAEGILGFPVLDELFGEADEYLGRARQGIRTGYEKAARAAGMTDSEIAMAYGIGGFGGMLVPVGASMGIARLALRGAKVAEKTGDAASFLSNSARFLSMGTLVEEGVAGAFYGAVLMPSETYDERMRHALGESANFAMGRMIFNGLAGTTKTLFHQRKYLRMKDADEVARNERANAQGSITELSQQEIEVMNELNNTERTVMQSLAAQKAIEQGQDYVIFRGLEDLAAQRGFTRFSYKLGRTEYFDDVIPFRDDMRARFPDKTIEVYKVGDDYQLHAGTKGLNNQQKKDLKNPLFQGFYRGQEVWNGKKRYIFAGEAYSGKGKARKVNPDKIKVLIPERADGKTVNINRKGVQAGFFGRELIPEMETNPDRVRGIFADFDSYVDDQLRDAWASRTKLSENELMLMAREGTLAVDDLMRRDLEFNGAVFPENYGALVNGLTPETQTRVEMLMRNLDQIPPERQGEVIQEIARLTTGNREQFLRELGENGFAAGGLNDSSQLLTTDELVRGYFISRNIDAGAIDGAALKGVLNEHYVSRLYKDIEGSEINKIFQRELDEFIKNSEDYTPTVAEIAAARGYRHVEHSNGSSTGYDLESGKAWSFVDDETAEQFYSTVWRDAGDPVVPGAFVGNVFRPSMPSQFELDADYLDPLGAAGIQTRQFRDKFFRPFRNIFVAAEEASGLPFFTKGYNQIDNGFQALRLEADPLARTYSAIWKPLEKEERLRVGMMLREIDNKAPTTKAQLTRADIKGIADDMGVSAQGLDAYWKNRQLFDRLFRESDLIDADFQHHYYARLKPYADRNGGIIPETSLDRGTPAMKHTANMARTGQLEPDLEFDPMIVGHRYIRAHLFQKHVAPSARALGEMIDTKYKDLSPEQLSQIMQRRGQSFEGMTPEAKAAFLENTNVFPPGFMEHSKEFLNIVTGTTQNEALRGNARIVNYFLNKLGIDISVDLVREFQASTIGAFYGSTMAFRLKQVIRNTIQNMFFVWPQLGGKHYVGAMKKTLDYDGFVKAADAMALRIGEGGRPFGDEFFNNPFVRDMINDGIVTDGSLKGSVFKGATKLGYYTAVGLREKVTKVGMALYQSADVQNRVQAFWWKRLHTEEWLKKYRAGQITKEVFDDNGLAFNYKAEIDEFHRVLDRLGDDAALDLAGKWAGDNANFIYQKAAQPAYNQKFVGKLAGMFGYWPMWMKENYINAWKNAASARQRAQLFGGVAAMSLIFANMGYQTGVDMMAYIAPLSITQWSGGPAVSFAIDAYQVTEAPADKKMTAMGRLATEIGRLQAPGSIFFYDTRNAWEELSLGNPDLAALSMLVGRVDPTPGSNAAWDRIYSRRPGELVPQIPRARFDTEGIDIDTLNQPIDLDSFIRDNMTNPVLTQYLKENPQ